MAAKPWNGDPVRCLDAAAQAQLVAWVGQQLGITLAELRKALQVERGQRMYLSPVWWVLAKHDLRRKKALYAAGRDAPRVVVLCGALIKAVARREDPRRFKFLDKTGPRLAFARRYGRTPD